MTPVVLPQLIKGMEEAVISARLKQPGDRVEQGEPIFEVETEKAIVEIESPAAGIIGRFDCQADETVKVGAPLCWIRVEPQNTEDLASKPVKENEDVILPFNLPQPQAALEQNPVALAAGAEMSTPAAPVYGGAALYQPPADYPVLVDSVRTPRPIGFNPRVIAPSSNVAPSAVMSSVISEPISDPRPAIPTESIELPRIAQTVQMSPLRRTIARRMSQSAQTIPTSVLYRKADITELVKMRLKINRFSKAKISLNDYVTKATVMALAAMPEINSTLEDDTIVYYSDVNLGFAVDAKGLLFVPVIHKAHEMDILDISTQSKRLIEKAEQGKLTLEEMANPTFTISNTGIFGVEYTVPIILPPQSGILGVGATLEEPVEKDGKWETHKKIGLSYAFDHRIIDGALGAKFLQKLIEFLEEPLQMIWTE